VPDFCGDKLIDFKLNGTTTTYFSANNSDYIYFSPPIDTKDFDTGEATVQVRMKNYPDVPSLSIEFTATILGSVVPEIENQVYFQDSSSLTIQYEQF